MAIKREIIIEVDDQGAIKSIEGLTDEMKDFARATDEATDSTAEFEASIQKQQAQMQILDGAVNLVGGSIETLAGGLALSGAITDEQAERFEAAAVGAIALADGTRRTIDGIVNLREGIQKLGGAQKIATGITKAFGVATKVALGPVGLAIAAFAAITAAVVLLKDKFEAVNKVFTFFAGIVNKVATAIGLGKTEAEKFAESQGELAKQTEFELKLLQAQGASTEELVKKERQLLTQRKNAAKTDEERLAASQELALFEARVVREQQEAEKRLADERRKAAAERKAQREAEAKAAEEEAKRIAEEAIKAEQSRVDTISGILQKFREQEEDIQAGTEANRLELEKQRQLKELEALNATEEEKAQIIEFYNNRILEAQKQADEEATASAQEAADKKTEADKAASDAAVLLAEQEAAAKEAALNGSVDAIQSALSSLFGESKAVAKANVLIDAAQAAIGIFKSGQSIPAPFNAIFIAAQLGALAAASAKSIQEINSAQPGSSGSPSTPKPSSGGVPRLAGATTTASLGAPTTTPQAEPIKAYVLTGDVTDGLEAETRIQQRRKL